MRDGGGPELRPIRPPSRATVAATLLLLSVTLGLARPTWARPPDLNPVDMILLDLATRGIPHRHMIDQPPAPPEFEAAPDSLDLSPAAARVAQIAARNGDRRYLMVDKVHGKLILFADGKPIFASAALTGASLADRLPPDAISKSVHQHIGVKYKVTPAGRFTMSRGHDDALGETLDINELQGNDWTIAVHQVFLGDRSEHRDARLLSPNVEDKHITTGCIDVDPRTIRRLLRLLPAGDATPIYILPTDESLIARLFQTRDSVSGAHAALPVRRGPV
jgi:hypothetical protein